MNYLTRNHLYSFIVILFVLVYITSCFTSRATIAPTPTPTYGPNAITNNRTPLYNGPGPGPDSGGIQIGSLDPNTPVVVISKATIYPGTFFRIEVPSSQNSGWVPRENLKFYIDMDQVPEEAVTPIPTSPPTSTPIPSPTSLVEPTSTPSPEERDLSQEIVETELLLKVCRLVEGIPGSTSYNSEETGIHPILILDVKDRDLLQLPDRWRSTSIRDIELIACIGQPQKALVERCNYTIGEIKRYRVQRLVVLVEAKTGNAIATNTFSGNKPRSCRTTESIGVDDIVGDDVLPDTIINWLEPFVEKR